MRLEIAPTGPGETEDYRNIVKPAITYTLARLETSPAKETRLRQIGAISKPHLPCVGWFSVPPNILIRWNKSRDSEILPPSKLNSPILQQDYLW